MVIEIPDKILLEAHSEQKIRLEIAVALYEKGLLAMASAAQLAGISRIAFQTVLAERGIAQQRGYAAPDTVPDQLNESDIAFLQLSRPVQKGFDFDEILKKQGYSQPDKARLQQAIRELDVQEPLDEMLATLTR